MANRRSNKRHIHHKQYVNITIDPKDMQLNSKARERLSDAVNNYKQKQQQEPELTKEQENFTINFLISVVTFILYCVIIYQHGNSDLWLATILMDIMLYNKAKNWLSEHPFWFNVYVGVITTAVLSGFNIHPLEYILNF